MSAYRRIPVSGEGFKPYDVIVGAGLLEDAETWVGPFLVNKRVVMVTDSNVGPLHADRILAQFEAAGHKTHKIVVPAGEESKSYDGLKFVVDAMLDYGLDRKDVVIALGGGVIGDLTGFACAIYMRGIDFIQIPTTVLAQVEFVRRRQDGHRPRKGQEPDRRLLAAAPGAVRSGYPQNPAGA
ncbi:3-dehydroquinate synthase [Asticcacaulis sp. MM231]